MGSLSEAGIEPASVTSSALAGGISLPAPPGKPCHLPSNNEMPSRGLPGGSAVKIVLAVQEPLETQVQSLGREDPLEEGTATHSSILAWRIPWTEEPSGL